LPLTLKYAKNDLVKNLAVHSDDSFNKSSGRSLCLALRPAGLAFSSGFAWVIGCPGGATGFRIPPKIGLLLSFLEPFLRVAFVIQAVLKVKL
jgi:hypothetical protein